MTKADLIECLHLVILLMGGIFAIGVLISFGAKLLIATTFWKDKQDR